MAGQIIDSVAKSGKQYGTHLFKVRSEVLMPRAVRMHSNWNFCILLAGVQSWSSLPGRWCGGFLESYTHTDSLAVPPWGVNPRETKMLVYIETCPRCSEWLM